MRAGGWTKGARRARRREVHVESFRDWEIFERDDWLCGICALPVDPDLRFPDPESVSLDHIVPLSEGGTHVPSNVRCSHLVCNMRRGTKPA
jgi:hypothetical protein